MTPTIQPIVGTQCCGTCGHTPDSEPLRCGKTDNLYVDYFYHCPLWRPKRVGLYILGGAKQ